MSTYVINEKNQAIITMQVAQSEIEKATDKVYKKTAHKYAVPGFRKGKAPRKVLETTYGQGLFFEDAFNEIFPVVYDAAIIEHDLIAVDRPAIDIVDITDADGITFTATVDLKPVVVLGTYTGIKCEEVAYNVSDADILAEIAKEQEKVSRMVEVTDRAVELGDQITLDYSGSVDGVKFPGGTAEDQPLQIGSGHFIPGFEEQLVGMAIGQSGDITVKFPDEYQAEELKGKEAVFAVTIKSIKTKEMPEINDEFAKDVSEFDTLDEYKTDIKNRLTDAAKKKAANEQDDKMINKICENTNIIIPDSMVDRQVDYQIRDMEMRMSYQGLKLADYLQYTGMNIEKMREMYRPDAEKNVKIQLVLEAIKNAEGIVADEESINAELVKYAEMFKKSVDEYKNDVKPEEMEYIKDSIVIQKTLDFLRENNTFEPIADAKDKKETKPKAPKKATEKKTTTKTAKTTKAAE